MDKENFISSLRAFYQERPFHQFDIELASGNKVRVDQPDALAFRGQRAVVLTSDGLTHHLDHHGVVRISTTEEAASSSTYGLKDNGHAG